MSFINLDCNLQCWECPRNCSLKDLFLLPESIFNKVIMDSLKASAGMFIAAGGNPKVAELELKKNAVALSISRK